MNIRQLVKEEYNKWDEFVGEHPDGTIFHQTKWLTNFNSDPVITVIENNGGIVGGIALVKIKKHRLSGFQFNNYVPFYGPLLHPDKETEISAYNNHLTLLLDNLPKSKIYDLILRPGHQPFHPFIWKGFDIRVKVTTLISGTYDSFHASMNKNKLREIKKLRELVDNKQLFIDKAIRPEELMKLTAETEKQKNTVINDINYRTIFIKNFEKNKDCVNTITIKDNSGLLACLIYVYDQKTAFNIINSSKRIDHPVLKNINYLVLDEFIKDTLTANRKVDLEGSMLKGVEEFYRYLGGKQVPAYRLTKSSSVLYNMMRMVKLQKDGNK